MVKNKSMREKIKSKKQLLIVGGILVLVLVIIGMVGEEKNPYLQGTENGSQPIGGAQQNAEERMEQSQDEQGGDLTAPCPRSFHNNFHC